MYKCECCGKYFAEPEIKKNTYENYFGVSAMFSSSNSFNMPVCPYCESDQIDELNEYEIENELNSKQPDFIVNLKNNVYKIPTGETLIIPQNVKLQDLLEQLKLWGAGKVEVIL